jgi:hypothetical protein
MRSTNPAPLYARLIRQLQRRVVDRRRAPSGVTSVVSVAEFVRKGDTRRRGRKHNCHDGHARTSQAHSPARVERNVTLPPGSCGSGARSGSCRTSRDHRVITFDLRGHGRSDKPHDPARYGRALQWATAVGYGAATFIVLFALRVVSTYLQLDHFRLKVVETIASEEKRTKDLLELRPSSLTGFPQKQTTAVG